MKHLELHIIQSVPVSCLNRDDFGSPKSAFFGGVQRARISSQCWKRAAREMMAELAPEYFKGERTRLFIGPLAKAIEAKGLPAEAAAEAAREIAGKIAKLDAGKAAEVEKVKTLFFTSPAELDFMASSYAKAVAEKEKDPVKTVVTGVKKRAGTYGDAADIAFFGRMVASLVDLGVEGAAMFNNALSTGQVTNEIDFFTAVDDLQPEEQSGAGMAGTQEFNSAVYYRFAAVNLGMLFDGRHLGGLASEERRAVLSAFIEAVVKSVPKAKRNSMNANVLPSFVLGVVREKGHPIQLINAFEDPVKARDGLVAESVRRLMSEYQGVKTGWGISATTEAVFNGKDGLTFPEFLKKVVDDAVSE